MCLIGKKGTLSLKTADEDIVCYKLIKRNMKSLYKDFPYKIKETYCLELDKCLKVKNGITDQEEVDCIFEGFHAYTDIYTAMCIYKAFNRNPTYRAFYFHNIQLARCVIPKGSTYCTGSIFYQDPALKICYASNQIRIEGIVPASRFLQYMKKRF